MLNNGFEFWFTKEEIQTLNKINEIYRQIPPEEEWLMKLYEPCEPTHPDAKFLMPSEMLTQLNAWSGMRLSIKKLSQAMDKLGYGRPISKRIKNGSPRKVYPVIQRSELDEDLLQDEMRG